MKYNIIGDSNLSQCCKGNCNYAGKLEDEKNLDGCIMMII